jgi:hypothetical protein
MIAIHDKRIPQVYINSLKDQLPNTEFFAFECPGSTVYASILCHPDIYMFQADADTLVHSPGLPAHLLERLSAYGVDLIEGEKLPAGFYPDTALYNAVRVGGTVFHGFKNTEPAIISLIEEKGLKKCNVSQGYSRCSVLACSGSSVITSDRKIYEKAEKDNIKALLVSPGNVELPGEEYGFIGGAGGMTPDGRLVILGDIHRHEDAIRMQGFIEEHSCGCVQVKGAGLYDAGGLFFFSGKR